jgi:hypothetical protein
LLLSRHCQSSDLLACSSNSPSTCLPWPSTLSPCRPTTTLQDGQLTLRLASACARTAPLVAADQPCTSARLLVLAGATWPCAWLLPCTSSLPRRCPFQLPFQPQGELGATKHGRSALRPHSPWITRVLDDLPNTSRVHQYHIKLHQMVTVSAGVGVALSSPTRTAEPYPTVEACSITKPRERCVDYEEDVTNTQATTRQVEAANFRTARLGHSKPCVVRWHSLSTDDTINSSTLWTGLRPRCMALLPVWTQQRAVMRWSRRAF